MFCFPPRRILVAVDFSEPSARAYRAARVAARRFGARLEAVHCDAPLPPELSVYGSAAPSPSKRPELESKLRKLFPEADTLHILSGEPAPTILDLIRRRRPDLVVMGTHGNRGLGLAMLGSVAEAVLRRSPVPVLVTRKPLKTLKSVLAPIRDDRDAQSGLLAAALAAHAFKARLDVVNVVSDPADGVKAERFMSARLDELPKDVRRGVKPTIDVRVGRPIPEILRASLKRDLLVVVARPKSLLGDMILGTTAERLLRYSPIPLLAIPAPKRRGTVLLSL